MRVPHVLSAGKSCGRQHQPVKALNDNALQHDVASDDVTVVTGHFVRCLAKKGGPGGPLIISRNRWGRSCHRGSVIAKSKLYGRILPRLKQLVRGRELGIGLEATFADINAFVLVLLVYPNP